MSDADENRSSISRQTINHNAIEVACGAMSAGIEQNGCMVRRSFLVAAIATAMGITGGPLVRAEEEDAPGVDERPQKGDLLVFSEGDRAGQPIRPEDLPCGGPPAHAWPMDPTTRVVRNGSRLNELLVLRLDPAEIDDDTRSRAIDGILAYSAVCSHAGCPVTEWVKAFEGDKPVFKCPCHNSEYDPRQSAQVVFGPAPRRLAALPLTTMDQAIVVAALFVGKVGAQQNG